MLSQATFLLAHIANSGPVPLSAPLSRFPLLHPQSDEAAQAKWEKRKAELVEAIEQFEKELTDLNSKLEKTPSHLAWDKLPETEKFQRLAPSRKQLVDTVKATGRK